TDDDKAGDFPAVILAVDIDDWEYDQVGVNERDDAAETDAAVPKDRSQRNVAHRTNERKDSDNWPDDWSPNLCGDWMRDQKEFLPKIRRHPRSQCACNKQAAGDIFPYCSQVHDEVVTGCSETILGSDALQERASCHAHVHFGVTFHLAFVSLLRV